MKAMTSNQDSNDGIPRTDRPDMRSEEEGKQDSGEGTPDIEVGHVEEASSDQSTDGPDIGGGRLTDSSRLEEELAEARDRHLRLAAEFENYRKRTRQELGQSGARAQAALIGSLLDVLDDFARIVSMDPDTATAESVLEGVQLVERKLQRSLTEAGVESIDPDGEPFDPERMEAVMREPADSDDQDDVVSRVLQKGVIFKGHLVRPARVAVMKLD